jgi:hypothetical protein
MKTALQRLLNSVHAAVFDKGAAAETAFRLRHANGVVWSVADRVLTVQAGAAAPTSHALAAVTVGQLVTTLALAGYQITGLSSEFSGLSALVLVEGSGDQGVSDGDMVQGYTSLLWVLLSGYAGETLAAKAQIQQALRQMIITQAEAEWLDLWGSLYGVPRGIGELDPAYAARIPREAFRTRNNARSIEIAIMDATGYDVRIEEPWRDIFRLDESTLSGPHKLYDGITIGYHLIRPVALNSVDWDVVLPVVERNKSAGIIVSETVNKATNLYQVHIVMRSRSWPVGETWATAGTTWSAFAPRVASSHTSFQSILTWGADSVAWNTDVAVFSDIFDADPELYQTVNFNGEPVLYAFEPMYFGGI